MQDLGRWVLDLFLGVCSGLALGQTSVFYLLRVVYFDSWLWYSMTMLYLYLTLYFQIFPGRSDWFEVFSELPGWWVAHNLSRSCGALIPNILLWGIVDFFLSRWDQHVFDSLDLWWLVNNLGYFILDLAVFATIGHLTGHLPDSPIRKYNFFGSECLNLIQLIDHVERTRIFLTHQILILLNQLILRKILINPVDNRLLLPILLVLLGRHISFKKLFFPPINLGILSFIDTFMKSYQYLHWPLGQQVRIILLDSFKVNLALFVLWFSGKNP